MFSNLSSEGVEMQTAAVSASEAGPSGPMVLVHDIPISLIVQVQQGDDSSGWSLLELAGYFQLQMIIRHCADEDLLEAAWQRLLELGITHGDMYRLRLFVPHLRRECWDEADKGDMSCDDLLCAIDYAPRGVQEEALAILQQRQISPADLRYLESRLPWLRQWLAHRQN